MFGNCEVETHKIYRVIERNSDETSKQNNKLLFHGTNIDSGLGMLEEGFKPSTRGSSDQGFISLRVQDAQLNTLSPKPVSIMALTNPKRFLLMSYSIL